MNPTDLSGWIAAGLTFGTFACRDMAKLRALALLANLAFIAYGASAGLVPVLALHLVLLPVNLRRLVEQRRLRAGSRMLSPSLMRRPWHVTFFLALVVLMLCPPRAALALSPAQRLHAQAVESFRQSRFSEAYGRFVQLANAGHAPAARLALWMCEQSPELFGKDWDCSPDEVTDWALLARVPVPAIGTRIYEITALPAPGGSSNRVVR